VPGGGGVLASGIGGGWTGHGLDWLIVDDPHKDRAQAESRVYRDAVEAWFRSAGITRVEPGGSVIVVHTRWHPDDLIGRLEQDTEIGWERVHLQAINDEGQALWPARWPVERLDARRREAGPYEWASLYQGEPRPRGGTVFGDPTFCDALPKTGYTVNYGADLAYTAKTSADWSVCIRLLRVGDTYYIADVRRKQVDAPAFTMILRAMVAEAPGRILWHCSGTEKGAADFIRKTVPQLVTVPAKGDKFVRAQPVAAAWNAGKVLIPRDAPWASALVSELCNFSGVGDEQDDQVDALGSAHAGAAPSVGGYRDMQRICGDMPQWRV
jgi:predicted phage terminase large subunit-like protein